MEDIIADLEDQIAAAMSERLPQLQAFLVRPFAVICQASDTWVVARCRDAALCISLDTEQFGVGFLSGDAVLDNTDFYPTPELAAQAFGWAVANGT